MLPKIIAHGGAWNWDDALDAGKRAGLKEAVSIGYGILRQGGSAVEAQGKIHTATKSSF